MKEMIISSIISLIVIIIFILLIRKINCLKKLPSSKLKLNSFFRFYMKVEYYIEDIFHKYPKESTIRQFEKEVKKAGFKFELSSQFNEVIKGDATGAKDIILKYYNMSSLLNEKAYYVSLLEPSTSYNLIPFFLEEMKYFNLKSDGGLTNSINNFIINTRNLDYKDYYLTFLNKKELGENRWGLLEVVGKLKIKEAVPIILDILDEKDNGLVVFCIETLYAIDKTDKYIKYYKKYQYHEDNYVRTRVNKIIEKIEAKK